MSDENVEKMAAETVMGVVVENINKRYGRKQILQNISFRAGCGEQIVIVGRNGCGKTTLMQILAGVKRPDAGALYYFRQEPLKNRKYFRKYCGYVPQETPLLEELSVRDNLRLWGADKSEQYEHILQSFQLQELLKMEAGKLSGGMKRRLGIACALAEWPPILLLDEPTTALDIYYKSSIGEWLQKYRRMNGIVIMTTHDESEIVNADRCLVMQKGQLTELKKDEISISKIKEYINLT